MASFCLVATLVSACYAWSGDSAVRDAALAESLHQHRFRLDLNQYWSRTLITSEAFFYVCLRAKVTGEQASTDRCRQHVQNMLAGGKEPMCRSGIAGWSEAPTIMSLALSRRIANVWDKLNSVEKQRADAVMKACLVTAAAQQHSQALPKRYLLVDSAWAKTWNPNHQLSLFNLISANVYFGSPATTNQHLKAFRAADYVASFETLGLTILSQTWAELAKAPGFAALENGGMDSKGGTVPNVRQDFTYGNSNVPNDNVKLYEARCAAMYSHQVVSKHPTVNAHIVGDLKSPFEGQEGMCHEFATLDASGSRSSLNYVWDGVRGYVPARALLAATGFTPSAEWDAKMAVGMGDYLFKAKHGYIGFKNGKQTSVESEATIQKLGADFVHEIYTEYVKPLMGVPAMVSPSITVTATNKPMQTTTKAATGCHAHTAPSDDVQPVDVSLNAQNEAAFSVTLGNANINIVFAFAADGYATGIPAVFGTTACIFRSAKGQFEVYDGAKKTYVAENAVSTRANHKHMALVRIDPQAMTCRVRVDGTWLTDAPVQWRNTALGNKLTNFIVGSFTDNEQAGSVSVCPVAVGSSSTPAATATTTNAAMSDCQPGTALCACYQETQCFPGLTCNNGKCTGEMETGNAMSTMATTAATLSGELYKPSSDCEQGQPGCACLTGNSCTNVDSSVCEDSICIKKDCAGAEGCPCFENKCFEGLLCARLNEAGNTLCISQSVVGTDQPMSQASSTLTPISLMMLLLSFIALCI